jgi:signal transduction histidine kinase
VSLRRRVTLTTVVVFAVVLVAVIGVVQTAFGLILNRSATAVLNDHVQLAGQLARQNVAPELLVTRLENRSVQVRLELADGRTLGNLRTSSLADAGAKTRRLRLPNTVGPLADSQLILEVDARLLAGAHERLLRVLLITAAAALLVIAVAVPLAARYALAPLDTMTRLARDVATGRRGRRLSADRTDTELGRTATAFDDMLDALEGAERRALTSEEGMRRFVADAAHELRTPLAGISAAAEAVLQYPDDGDPQTRQRLVNVLGREARRASRIVDDLLDLARIDAGISLHRQPMDLRRLVDEHVERARLLHPQLVIATDGPPVRVQADPARIGQVVANLLDNACRVTPAGGQVHVTVSRRTTAARVAVCDSGPGVPVAQRERIFGRLVSLDGEGRESSSGAGLGLPIARGIARAHGGDVVCQDGPAGGAVFVLSLPEAS